MTVEMRRLEGDGYVQYAVGTSEPDVSMPPSDVIQWAEFRVHVYPSEVFTAATAGPIYDHYLANGSTVPAGLHLRQVDLGRSRFSQRRGRR